MIAELLNINLVEALGLDTIPGEKKDALLTQMQEVVENRINLEVLSILTEEQKGELNKILDSDGDLLKFLRESIPNFDIMVAETVANFKKEMLDMQQMAFAAK